MYFPEGIEMNRRHLLHHFRLVATAVVLSPVSLRTFSSSELVPLSELKKTDAEWRKVLPIEKFNILFKEHTEAPNSSPLNSEKRKGTFICAACYLPLFKSEYKYNSGTGWPSFFDVIPGAIGTSKDFKLIYPRTEYHCARCGGHQGHVFDDGPKPTGLRYCNNGLALEFIAHDEKLPELRS
jgi:peptide-methionine (R)-S-oxide reductase